MDPPLGWTPEPLKASSSHSHQVWLSPTGKTAYGVIYFTMPLPLGQEIALGGFLANMKKSEGESHLLERHDDPNLPGVRFVAEGGLYTVRANLIVRGWHGWAVYAGTKRNDVTIPSELETAERARENTSVGLPE